MPFVVCKICTCAQLNCSNVFRRHYHNALLYVPIFTTYGEINCVITYSAITHMQYLDYCDLVARSSTCFDWSPPLNTELQAPSALVFLSFPQILKKVVCFNLLICISECSSILNISVQHSLQVTLLQLFNHLSHWRIGQLACTSHSCQYHASLCELLFNRRNSSNDVISTFLSALPLVQNLTSPSAVLVIFPFSTQLVHATMTSQLLNCSLRR